MHVNKALARIDLNELIEITLANNKYYIILYKRKL